MKSSKGFAGKYGVSLITMNAFLRSAQLSKGSGKIAFRIDAAFIRHGLPRPKSTTLRDFCLQHGPFIREKGRNFKSGNAHKDIAFVKKTAINPNCDEFLFSYAWRKVRMEALRTHGARCQCCGASPADGAVMNVDHIKPRKLFPHLALDLDNLQILCHECNHGKGNWDQTDWRPDEVEESTKEFIRSIARGT